MMMKKQVGLVFTPVLITAWLFSGLAHAHHPLNGMPMETLLHGLLSGIAHPVLGFDHLFFIVVVGLTAAITRHALLSPLFAIVGVLAGVALSVLGVQWSLNEYAIAVSLLLLGGIAMVGRKLELVPTLSLFTVLGLFHGLAYGEALLTVNNQFAAVVTGYLVGLALVHWLLAVAAGKLITGAVQKAAAVNASGLSIRHRLGGALVTGVGAVYFLEGLESAALSALGI